MVIICNSIRGFRFVLRVEGLARNFVARCFSVPSQEEIVHLILRQRTPSQALESFRWASHISGFCHTQSTYKAVVKKLCAFGKFQMVHKLLEEMPVCIGSPPGDDVFIVVIRGFAHAGKGRKAVGVLDWVYGFGKKPSLKLYNAVLDVLVGQDIDLARDFYREKMMGSGVGGDHFTFGILMKGVCSTNRIGDAFKLLAVMKSRGLQPNTVIYNTLIHSLARNGKIGRGRSLMSEMLEPNDVTFNILISGYCKDGNLIQALVMLEKCFSLGFVPDVITVTKVVELLCAEGRGMEATELVERVESMGGIIDVVVYNTLIKGFCRLRKAKVGGKLLKVMERKGCLPDLNTYNVLIAGFCDSENLDSAIDLLHEMNSCGVGADFVTYETLIGGLCRGGKTAEGLSLLTLLAENQNSLDKHISFYNNVIYGFFRENKLGEAHCILVEMGRYFPVVASESLKILTLCKEDNIAEAVEIYNKMISDGSSLNALVYVCLIELMCKEGKVREAFELINEMVNKGYFPIASTFSFLINAFCQKEEIQNANKVLEEMNKRECLPDASCINPLIDILCREGEYCRACELLFHMIEKGTIPDHNTWNFLLMKQSGEHGQATLMSHCEQDTLNDILCSEFICKRTDFSIV